MELEIVLILIAALAIACIGISRRKQRVFREAAHQDELICIVTFYDRSVTLPLIDAFFQQEYITVRDLKREIRREGNKDLFVNTYRLGMPRRVDQGALAGYLSGIKTICSVQIKPK